MASFGAVLRAKWSSVRHFLARSRLLRVLLVTAGALLVVAIVADRALDEPLRRVIEKRMNRSLIGYSARLGTLDFRLFGLSMEVGDLVVSQKAFPDPPVLDVPRLSMSVAWRDLLYLRLVANATFEKPAIHLNLVQLQAENRDNLPLKDKGWQDALEAIYPLKINELQIVDGSLLYQDDSGLRPLDATDVDVVARNIRNVRSSDREYPSNVRITGTVFDVGKVVIDGRADFLAKPTPGLAARLELEQLELSYLDPIVGKYGLVVREGFLSGKGAFEYGKTIRLFDLESVVLTDASLDYLHGGEPSDNARKVVRKIAEKARETLNAPEVALHVRHLSMRNGTIGVVNRTVQPEYRVYFTNASLEIENFSNRAEDGPAEATLEASFMGSGPVHGAATFYPEGKEPNFALKLEIEKTQLVAMNDLLRAHGKFDVVGGEFALYTELRVQNGRIKGYLKPFFRDVNVYDARQDKKKNVFRKMYEGVVGGIAKALENRRDEVATIAEIDGPVEDPRSNTLQIIAKLVQNAFFKAIVPGFQREVARVAPLQYRAQRRKGST